MTTERRSPTSTVSALEGRLYLGALLAIVYAITWRTIGAHAPQAASSSPPERAPPIDRTAPSPSVGPGAPAPPNRAVWLDQLPLEQRPAIALPPGWTLADGTTATSAPVARTAPRQPSRIVRVPSRRVRTRSS